MDGCLLWVSKLLSRAAAILCACSANAAFNNDNIDIFAKNHEERNFLIAIRDIQCHTYSERYIMHIYTHVLIVWSLGWSEQTESEYIYRKCHYGESINTSIRLQHCMTRTDTIPVHSYQTLGFLSLRVGLYKYICGTATFVRNWDLQALWSGNRVTNRTR